MPRALWWPYGGGAGSYERGAPVPLPSGVGRTFQHPSSWRQIALLKPLDWHWSSPESGDLWCKSGVPKKSIRSHYAGWWSKRMRPILNRNVAEEALLLLFFFFTLVTGPRRSFSLKLSDTRVYEPQIPPNVPSLSIARRAHRVSSPPFAGTKKSW